MASMARAHFRTVLVHGDPALIPFGNTFTPWRDIEDLLYYTGYVSPPPPVPAPPRDGPVLVSCGGGKVGGTLLAAAAPGIDLLALADLDACLDRPVRA